MIKDSLDKLEAVCYELETVCKVGALPAEYSRLCDLAMKLNTTVAGTRELMPDEDNVREGAPVGAAEVRGEPTGIGTWRPSGRLRFKEVPRHTHQ